MTEVASLDGLEVVRGLIRVTSHLSAATPLEERMTKLCMEVTSILDCDRSSIMLWDGLHYRATYNWGNPPDIAAMFPRYKVAKHAPLIQRLLNSKDSFIFVNDARAVPATAAIATTARIESIVMAAMCEEDGSSLGFMTAEFNERIGEFDRQGAQVALGAARLAESAIRADRERTSRRRMANDFSAAVDDERRRLGREIHDEPLQQLFALCLRLKAIRQTCSDPVTRRELGLLAKDCRNASERLREVINDIHPETATPGSLASALQKILRDRATPAGLKWSVKHSGTEPTPPGAAAILLRIATQAIENILTHATASVVEVDIAADEAGTLLSIGDDGVGFDSGVKRPGRLGLISMRERADDAGGTFDVDRGPEGGTAVRIRIPHQPWSPTARH